MGDDATRQGLTAALTIHDGGQGSDLKPDKKKSCVGLLKAMGPGLMVCLADTDGGCLVTAAQSGAQFGYSLLLIQAILVPILYFAQELTVRLGILKGMGLTELMRDQFGPVTAWAAAAVLIVTCVGAIISEMSSIAGVFLMFGVPRWATCMGVSLVLLGVVVSGSYRKVEIIGVLFGAFELLFLYTMFATKPDAGELWDGLWTFKFNDSDWVALFAANIGAVIMPWMLYYQQSAICDKKMAVDELTYERVDTAFGAVLTQLIMASMLISIAASRSGSKIEKVADVSAALAPSIGDMAAKVLVTIGVTGASMVAALVVSLCTSWTIAEALGQPRSLNLPIREAKWFYSAYLGTCAIGFAVTASGVSIVQMNIVIEQINAIFMVPVIFMLLFLSVKKGILPEEHRVKGWYAWLLGVVFASVSIIAVYCTVSPLWS